jgi:hypothetical protein
MSIGNLYDQMVPYAQGSSGTYTKDRTTNSIATNPRIDQHKSSKF